MPIRDAVRSRIRWSNLGTATFEYCYSHRVGLCASGHYLRLTVRLFPSQEPNQLRNRLHWSPSVFEDIRRETDGRVLGPEGDARLFLTRCSLLPAGIHQCSARETARDHSFPSATPPTRFPFRGEQGDQLSNNPSQVQPSATQWQSTWVSLNIG
jgi:hypothetical protein